MKKNWRKWRKRIKKKKNKKIFPRPFFLLRSPLHGKKDQNRGEQRKEARKTTSPKVSNTQTQDKKYSDALKSEVFGSDQKDYQKVFQLRLFAPSTQIKIKDVISCFNGVQQGKSFFGFRKVGRGPACFFPFPRTTMSEAPQTPTHQATEILNPWLQRASIPVLNSYQPLCFVHLRKSEIRGTACESEQRTPFSCRWERHHQEDS